MYRLVIYWDDERVEVAAQGTQEEVIKAMPAVAARINSDEALWALEYEPAKVTVDAQQVATQLGVNGYGRH